MILSNYLLMGAGVAAAISLVVATHWIDNLRSDNATLRRDLQSQTQARNTAEWLLQNQMQAMQVFSAIRAANIAARAADENQRDEAKQKITAATADVCGNGPVPAAAAGELQRLERATRAASGFITSD
ncbi:DUF2570 domain-containing protein [Erwinia sp. HR93]|uniref:DUF2570 domain-containing protein n=1 Tax=Erwinia sp. HR93 TaxID=3094840 RepID=UPI002ADEC974|nr:DUF2570 domain-containing protein [Erwinia sp. HR93]MEA1062269.1 DUF2570 domain-containing protein [Erwinia sp. HR93]MEA1063924.1 DUF2570 domain-containing protein [Erwinia sp. HR93]